MVLTWCNVCDLYLVRCSGVNHPALCPEIEPDEQEGREMDKFFSHCARCHKKFEKGITIWRIPSGWIHPECATEEDRKAMD